MSTNNICFHEEIRKILWGYLFLSVAMHKDALISLCSCICMCHLIHYFSNRDLKFIVTLLPYLNQVKNTQFTL